MPEIISSPNAHPFKGQLLYLAEIFSAVDVAYWEEIPGDRIDTSWGEKVIKHGRKRFLGVTAIRDYREPYAVKQARFLMGGKSSASSIVAEVESKGENNIVIPDTYNVPVSEDDPFAPPIIDGFNDYLNGCTTKGIADCRYGVRMALVRRFDAFDLALHLKEAP